VKSEQCYSGVNEHGVCLDTEIVRVPLPKSLKAACVVELAQLADGWRAGFERRLNTSSESSAPSKHSEKFPTAAAAVVSELARSQRFFAEITSGKAADCDGKQDYVRAKAVLAKVRAFAASHFPSPDQETAMIATADPKQIRKQLREDALIKSKRKLADGPLNSDPLPPLAGSSPVNVKPAESTGTNGTEATNGHSSQPSPKSHPGRKQAPDPLVPVFSDAIVMLPLRLIDRHPDNGPADDPRLTQLDDLCASLQRHRLQEPVIVRLLESGRYQLLSGERRVNAAREVHWKDIPARVRECDAAEALETLAFLNGQRKDLDPIARARLAQRLMQSVAEGGAGLKRDDAARQVGVESGSRLSSLVGLLELPAVWQQRVASGELAPSLAETLRRVAHVKPIIAALEEDWANQGNCDTFASRVRLEDAIGDAIHYDLRAIPERLPLDKLPAETREKLGVVSIASAGEGRGKQSEQLYATNKDLLGKLTVARAAKATVEQAAKAGAEPEGATERGRDGAKEKRQPSPAEEKAKAKEAEERLALNIRAWRHEWLKELIAARMEDQDWVATKFLCWLLTQFGRYGFGVPEVLAATIAQMAGSKRPAAGWELIDSLKLHSFSPATIRQSQTYQRSFQLDEVLKIVCRVVLSTADSDPRFPRVPYEVADGLARDYGIDLAAEWIGLQNSRLMGKNPGAEARVEALYQLHTTAQLDSLGDARGVYVRDAATKKIKVQLLTGKLIELPACVAPVAAAVAPQKRKGAKGAKAAKKKAKG